jgi:lipoprotein-anchoring transpeptidase ErfK/SrfK
VAARDVVRPRRAARPAAVAATERWIDVDVGTQTMVVYEGDRPVYATLVSSGRRERDHDTPLGEFRIWVKVGETTMDDIGNADAAEDYSVEAVPWVQYFDGSIAFHAAYWHRRFGNRMSHGCVNLSPKDARWLYGFTSPTVPDGWVAVHPTDNERGTFVRVRDSAG